MPKRLIVDTVGEAIRSSVEGKSAREGGQGCSMQIEENQHSIKPLNEERILLVEIEPAESSGQRWLVYTRWPIFSHFAMFFVLFRS